ncbi:MAG: glycosyltransferase family 4 protein [Armatimonadetes bacterium]|nr:glycosyltransferase family 4 protein [Armatimonadota bacterium]
MIDVLYVITRLVLGGASRMLLTLLEGLPSARFRVSVAFGPSEERNLEEEVRRRAHRLYPVPSLIRPVSLFQDLRTLRALEAILRSQPFHILHSHTSKAGFLGRLAGARQKVPIVLHTPHGHVLEGFFSRFETIAYKAAERIASAWCHRIVALSEQEKNFYITHRVAPAKKVVVIPNGIDVGKTALSRPGREIRSELGIGCDDFLVMAVGRLVEEKGYSELCEAFSLFLKTGVKANLVILGDGPLKTRLLRETAPLDGAVRFPGALYPAMEYISASDVLVLPSRYEGFGLVLLEAMACGVPVVASAVGGVPEIIADRDNGLLVPPRNPEKLALALKSLYDSRDSRLTMGERGRDTVLRRFQASRSVADTANLYEELLLRKVQ